MHLNSLNFNKIICLRVGTPPLSKNPESVSALSISAPRLSSAMTKRRAKSIGRVKAHSHQVKVKTKTKIFFDVWNLFFGLFYWVFDLFCFRVHFRSVWTDPSGVPYSLTPKDQIFLNIIRFSVNLVKSEAAPTKATFHDAFRGEARFSIQDGFWIRPWFLHLQWISYGKLQLSRRNWHSILPIFLKNSWRRILKFDPSVVAVDLRSMRPDLIHYWKPWQHKKKILGSESFARWLVSLALAALAIEIALALAIGS